MSMSQYLDDIIAYDYMSSDEYDFNYFYDGASVLGRSLEGLDKSLLWESSDEEVVSVDNGVVTAKKAGSAVITVKSVDGSDISALCNVTVTELISEPTKSSDTSENPSDNSNNPSNSSQLQSSNTSPTAAPTTAVTPSTIKTAAKPAKVVKVKLKLKKKKLNVSWKKVSGITGYEIVSATNNKFTKNIKSYTVKKNKMTIKKLKPKMKYFVKVRAYRLVNGRKYFGKWSKVVKKKIK